MTMEITYVYYTEIIMANKRKNIIHKLGIRVPLARELHYVESNISYDGTLQFLLSLTVSQTRRNSRQDVSPVVGAGEVYCTGLLQYQYSIRAYVFKGFSLFQDSNL